MLDEITPQDYLNDLHHLGFSELFDPRLSLHEQTHAIQRVKKNLGELTVKLRRHHHVLRRQQQAKHDVKVEHTLAQFNVLHHLIRELAHEVVLFEKQLASGKIRYQRFEFGRYIFGDDVLGEWFIGDDSDYANWREASELKQRLTYYKCEGRSLVEQLAELHVEFKTQKALRCKIHKQLHQQSRAGYMARRLFVLFMLMMWHMAVGGYVYFYVGHQLGLIGFGMAGLFFVLMPFVYSRWQQRNAKLKAIVRETQAQIKRIQTKAAAIQNRYNPIKAQMSELQKKYESLYATLAKRKHVAVL